MMTSRNSHDTFSVNFILKGLTSFLIGCYLLIGTYLLKTMLTGFVADGNPMGFTSPEILEILFFIVAFLVFLFSSLALFFAGRRNARKFHYKLWNGKTKKAFWKYLLSITLIFVILIYLTSEGFIDYITPVFLISYGILLFLLRNPKRKSLLILSGISILFGIYCFVIPTYWYSSLFVLGIAHLTYGIAVRN